MKQLSSIILILCFGVLSFVHAQEEHSILVYGTASIFVAPDEMIIQLTSEHVDENLQVAKSKTESQINSVKKILKQYKIESKHIQTKSLTNGRFYDNNIRKFSGYVSRHVLMFCLRDLDQFDTIFDQLLLMKLSKVESPQLIASNYKTIKDEAYVAAIQDARSRAELFAKSTGQQLGQTITIKELVNHNTRNSGAYSNGQDQSSSSATEQFAPGQLEVRAQVEIKYQLLL